MHGAEGREGQGEGKEGQAEEGKSTDARRPTDPARIPGLLHRQESQPLTWAKFPSAVSNSSPSISSPLLHLLPLASILLFVTPHLEFLKVEKFLCVL